LVDAGVGGGQPAAQILGGGAFRGGGMLGGGQLVLEPAGVGAGGGELGLDGVSGGGEVLGAPVGGVEVGAHSVDLLGEPGVVGVGEIGAAGGVGELAAQVGVGGAGGVELLAERAGLSVCGGGPSVCFFAAVGFVLLAGQRCRCGGLGLAAVVFGGGNAVEGRPDLVVGVAAGGGGSPLGLGGGSLARGCGRRRPRAGRGSPGRVRSPRSGPG
jgi:hypothetical protein